MLVFLVRKRRPAFVLTLLGELSLAASFAVYFALVEPTNVEMKSWALSMHSRRTGHGGATVGIRTRGTLWALWELLWYPNSGPIKL